MPPLRWRSIRHRSVRLSIDPHRTSLGGYTLKATTRSAVLASLTAAAVLALGAAAPAQAGCSNVVTKGVAVCAPGSTGSPATDVPVYAPPPARADVPMVPAPASGSHTPAAPSQPVKGFAPTEDPVIAGVPAEAPTAGPSASGTAAATPSATPGTATSLAATQDASVAPSPGQIQDEKASQTDAGTPAGFVVGILAVLLLAAGAWRWRRTRKPRHAGGAGASRR